MAHAILSATGLLDEKIRPEFKKNLKIYVKKFVSDFYVRFYLSFSAIRYATPAYFTLSGFAAMNFSQEDDDLSPASGLFIW